MNKEWQQATSEDNVRKIGALLDGGQNVDVRDEHGQTALMNAARAGHVQVIQVLVDAGADLNATAKYNLTALMLAIINGHTQIAEFLVSAGADVAVRGTGAPGFSGKTALDLAVERDLTEVAAALRQKHLREAG
jgi:ankyrin repeat protein